MMSEINALAPILFRIRSRTQAFDGTPAEGQRRTNAPSPEACEPLISTTA